MLLAMKTIFQIILQSEVLHVKLLSINYMGKQFLIISKMSMFIKTTSFFIIAHSIEIDITFTENKKEEFPF